MFISSHLEQAVELKKTLCGTIFRIFYSAASWERRSKPGSKVRETWWWTRIGTRSLEAGWERRSKPGSVVGQTWLWAWIGTTSLEAGWERRSKPGNVVRETWWWTWMGTRSLEAGWKSRSEQEDRSSWLQGIMDGQWLDLWFSSRQYQPMMTIKCIIFNTTVFQAKRARYIFQNY